MSHPVVMFHETGERRGIRRWIAKIPWWLPMGAIWYPTIFWFLRRLDDGGDEPLGLLTLTMAAVIWWRDRKHLAGGRHHRLAGALVLVVSVTSIGLFPPMIRAALAITGTGLWFGLQRNPALQGLFLLSLPVVASMRFYLGYPMRLATAEGAFRLLELGGIVVARHGAAIVIGGVRTGVDPACDGVLMLWHALAAAMALAAIHRLSWKSVFATGTLAVLLAMPANVIRVAWLAVENSGRVTPTGISHDLIGLICFLITLPPLWWWASKNSRPKGPEIATPPVGAIERLILILTALLTPWLTARSTRRETSMPLSAPTSFLNLNGEARPLLPLGGFPEVAAFHSTFPGTVSSRALGDKLVVLRRVTTATRKLHPSCDCLRAEGFEISLASIMRFPDGSEWSRFFATKQGMRWIVHERIVSEQDGSAWTDAPAWYWSALAHPLNGPWRAETVISR